MRENILWSDYQHSIHTKIDLLQLGFESVVQESDNVFCDNRAGGISLLIRQILFRKKLFIATTRNIIQHIYSLEVLQYILSWWAPPTS